MTNPVDPLAQWHCLFKWPRPANESHRYHMGLSSHKCYRLLHAGDELHRCPCNETYTVTEPTRANTAAKADVCKYTWPVIFVPESDTNVHHRNTSSSHECILTFHSVNEIHECACGFQHFQEFANGELLRATDQLCSFKWIEVPTDGAVVVSWSDGAVGAVEHKCVRIAHLDTTTHRCGCLAQTIFGHKTVHKVEDALSNFMNEMNRTGSAEFAPLVPRDSQLVYSVQWSNTYHRFFATCPQYPLLSYISPDPMDAIQGLMASVRFQLELERVTKSQEQNDHEL
jgi:hypothetical protein